MTILVATSAALPGLAPDDRLLLRALRALGLSAEPAVWEDPHAAWHEASLCVIRSTWDYAYRRSEFLAWAERTAARLALWNPAPVVVWNTHKRYLVDLADRGRDRGGRDVARGIGGWGRCARRAALEQRGSGAARRSRGGSGRGTD